LLTEAGGAPNSVDGFIMAAVWFTRGEIATGQALALHNLASNGLITRTGTGTVTARSVAAGTGITVSNGDGVSGNPTVGLTGQALAVDLQN
jgi:hypothetical protein